MRIFFLKSLESKLSEKEVDFETKRLQQKRLSVRRSPWSARPRGAQLLAFSGIFAAPPPQFQPVMGIN